MNRLSTFCHCPQEATSRAAPQWPCAPPSRTLAAGAQVALGTDTTGALLLTETLPGAKDRNRDGSHSRVNLPSVSGSTISSSQRGRQNRPLVAELIAFPAAPLQVSRGASSHPVLGRRGLRSCLCFAPLSMGSTTLFFFFFGDCTKSLPPTHNCLSFQGSTGAFPRSVFCPPAWRTRHSTHSQASPSPASG